MNRIFLKNIIRNIRYPLFFPFIIIPIGWFMYGISLILQQPELIGTTFFVEHCKVFLEAIHRTGRFISTNASLFVVISLTLKLSNYSIANTLLSVLCYYFMLNSFNNLLPTILTQTIYKDFITTYMISPFHMIGGIILSIATTISTRNFDFDIIINNRKESRKYFFSLFKSFLFGVIISIVLSYIWVYIINLIIFFNSETNNNNILERFLNGFLNVFTSPVGIYRSYDLILRQTFLGGTFKLPENFTLIYGYENIWLAQLNLKNIMFTCSDSLAFIYVKNIFVMPAIMYALITTSYAENKNMLRFFLGIFIILSFCLGYTIPIEFILLFSSTFLFVFTSIIVGIISLIIYILGLYFPIHMITLSGGGIIDFIFLGIIPGVWRTGAWLLILIGILIFPLIYFLYVYIIREYNIKCFGRKYNESSIFRNKTKYNIIKIDYKKSKIKKIIRALGGKNNIVSLEPNNYSIDIKIKDLSKINKIELKSNGVAGLFINESDNTINIILGNMNHEYYKQFIKYLI